MTQLNECLLLVTGIYQMKLFTCYDVLFIYFHGSDSFTNLMHENKLLPNAEYQCY